jgi:hypothetical protein
MIADPDQGIVPPHIPHIPHAPPRGPIGDVERIDVNHGEEEPWREHVARQATVVAAQPCSNPCMDGATSTTAAGRDHARFMSPG